jgi:two-component system cell cycle sensor histidine kinase/response regulator CckA
MSRRLRSLAVLFPALLAAIVLAVALVTGSIVERQMAGELIRARGTELQAGAARVAGMLASGFPGVQRQLEERFEAPGAGSRLFGARDATQMTRELQRVALPSSDSTLMLAVLVSRRAEVRGALGTPGEGPEATWAVDAAFAGTLDTAGLTVGHVLQTASGPAFGLAYPVRNAEGQLLGWYTEVRRIRARGVDDIRALIGVPTLLVGRPFAGAWTDLQAIVDPPAAITAMDSVVRVRTVARGDAVGLATAVPGTHWVVWVEEPTEGVLAPIDALFRRLWPAIAVIALIGAALAWMLGRLAAKRIRAVAEEIDHALVAHAAEQRTTAHSSEDELAALERSYAQLEQRIAQQRRLDEQQLQSQKLESIGRMAGGIAHDFNNLLTVITNYGEMARDQLPEASPARDDVAEVLRAADRATSLTRQLLAFSRKHLIDPRPVDINAVLIESDRMLARVMPANVERSLDLTRGRLVVTMDPVQLEQVVMNLVINAVDAMPGGGRLVIRTTDEILEEDSASRGGTPAGPYACLAVSDSGSGMPPETLARIFDPFFTTKPVGKGTGLGLATVHGIVTQARGRVWAYSEMGVGTTLKVYLPLSPDAPSTELPSARADRPRTPATGRLLVVEDEDGTRAITARILRQAGFEVQEFPRGDLALAWLEGEQDLRDVRAIVSDVMMPGISGIELARRAGQRWPSLRCVLMSGYSDTGDRLGDLPGPRPIILEKPFTANSLLDAVDEAIRR